MILLVLGQSNACNCGQGLHSSKSGRVIDAKRGTIHPMADPLSGDASEQGEGGSIWSRLADFIPDLTVIPAATAGSYVKDWERLIDLVMMRLTVKPTHVVWQQGEAEANHTNMSSCEYAQRVGVIFEKMRVEFYTPVFVAQCTVCENGDHAFSNHAAIRAGQRLLVNPAKQIYAGPDLDRVTERFDGCHFSAAGLDRGARLWYDCLMTVAAVAAE
jgi:hypothetical protein